MHTCALLDEKNRSCLRGSGSARWLWGRNWRKRTAGRQSWQVGVKPLRELWGVVAAEGATRAVFVTTGTYTGAARSFASDKPLELDGPALAALVNAAGRHGILPQAVAARNPTEIVCPRCGRPMVERTARRGANSGQTFWGCSGFPDCRQTLPT